VARAIASGENPILSLPSRDPASESLQSIQSARTEDHLRAPFREHDRGRLADSAARTRDDDDLAFDSVHKVLHFQYLICLDLPGVNR
jgi:hypothetical protein